MEYPLDKVTVWDTLVDFRVRPIRASWIARDMYALVENLLVRTPYNAPSLVKMLAVVHSNFSGCTGLSC